MTEFFQKFQEKIDMLNKIKITLTESIRSRQEFSNQVKMTLTEINSNMRKLNGFINNITKKISDLEKTHGINKSSIDIKKDELVTKNSKISDDLDKITRLKNEYDNYKNQMTQEIQNKQKQIDELEGQLRELTSQKEVSESKAVALENELAGKGQQQAVHKEELDKLTNQLKMEIANRDKKITDLNNDLEKKTFDLKENFAKIQKNLEEKQEEVNQLNDEILTLTQANDILKQNITTATTSIDEVTKQLQEIALTIKGSENKEEIEQLLNSITKQLESSIQNILSPNKNKSLMTEEKTNVDQNMKVEYRGSTFTYNNLKNILGGKAKQDKRPDNKYKLALNALIKLEDNEHMDEATLLQEINKILQNNSINVKNNKIMGGRKTKKYVKQKGGFTYKNTMKRKSIKSYSRRRSRRSSRISS